MSWWLLFKGRFGHALRRGHNEFRRSVLIGRRMLYASRATTSIREAHEEMGHLLDQSILAREHVWNNPRIEYLMRLIRECETELHEMENEIKRLKQLPDVTSER